MSGLSLATMLQNGNYDPSKVVVVRHSPGDAELRKRLPWLATDLPDIYNAYQSFQTKVVSTFKKCDYIASFIGQKSSKAIFVGLYKREDEGQQLSPRAYIDHESRRTLVEYGMKDESESEITVVNYYFKLELISGFYGALKGKLIVDWPPPHISWCRKADNNDFPISAILEDSAFEKGMPPWRELTLSWTDLQTIPKSWRGKLQEWRGIYLIFDRSDGRSYVGSASGGENLDHRWRNYADSGDGGNKHLLGRDHNSFCFSILERLSPDLPLDEVVARENTWKERLHTRYPVGLNAN